MLARLTRLAGRPTTWGCARRRCTASTTELGGYIARPAAAVILQLIGTQAAFDQLQEDAESTYRLRVLQPLPQMEWWVPEG